MTDRNVAVQQTITMRVEKRNFTFLHKTDTPSVSEISTDFVLDIELAFLVAELVSAVSDSVHRWSTLCFSSLSLSIEIFVCRSNGHNVVRI